MSENGAHLPDGLTLEQLDELVAQRARQKRNEYNANHPEVVLRRRIATSINLLTKHGYVVLPPNKDKVMEDIRAGRGLKPIIREDE